MSGASMNRNKVMSTEVEVELMEPEKQPQWVLDAVLNAMPLAESPNITASAVMDLQHPPVFTLVLFVTLWITFVLCRLLMPPLVGSEAHISPPDPRLIFRTVGHYPHCEDDRLQLWRLLTVQLVHSGWTHLLGNSVLGLGTGAMLESHTGTLFAAATFEAAVVVGSLAHSFVLPYHALIGCSHGVYGWCGALLCYCLSHLRQGRANALLAAAMSAIIALDVFMYVFYYTPNRAYEAHYAGLLTGFMISFCCFGGWALSTPGDRTVSKTKVHLGMASRCGVCCLFVGLVMYLAVHVGTSWPPAPPFNPTLHALPAGSCCAALFRLAPPGGNLTRSYVTDNYRCGAGYNLQPPG
jgi:membrane associated rhomboid family serine protease